MAQDPEAEQAQQQPQEKARSGEIDHACPQEANAIGITEPATILTDFLLAVLAFWCALHLLAYDRQEPGVSRALWGWGMASLGFSSLAGGTYHGFHGVMRPGAAAALWTATSIGVGLMGTLWLSGSLAAALEGRWRGLALAAAGLKFLAFAAWMARHDAYRYVVFDTALSSIAILALHTMTALSRQPASRWILAGLLVSFAAAAVQLLGISPHPRFNHNDLYHVIQLPGVYLLYRGGALLGGRRAIAAGRAGRDATG